MEFSVHSCSSVFVLILATMISHPNQIFSRADEIVLRLSDMCSPACRSDLICVEQTPVCTFTDCPFIRSCVPTAALPESLLEERNRNHRLQSAIRNKPGCPTNFLPGPCVTQCRHDSDCRHGSLCCSNGCGHVCRPDSRGQQTPRRGMCPWYLIGSDETCDTECSNDHECPGMQKCCQTSCGSTCSMPCFYWLSDTSLWQLSARCDRPSPNARTPDVRKRKNELDIIRNAARHHHHHHHHHRANEIINVDGEI